MDFFRRGEKRPTSFDHARILVPVLGDDEVDGPALKVAALLLGGREGVEASLLHVIEVPFDRTLDAEDEAAVARADEILSRAEALLAARGIPTRTQHGAGARRRPGHRRRRERARRRPHRDGASLQEAIRGTMGRGTHRPVRHAQLDRSRSGACAPRRRSWHTRHEGHHRRLRPGRSTRRRGARQPRRARHRHRHQPARLQPAATGLRRRERRAATGRTRTSCAPPAPSRPTSSWRSPRATTATRWPRSWPSTRSARRASSPRSTTRCAARRTAPLGVETICRTIILGDALVLAAQEGAEATNGFVEPATAEPRRCAPHAGSPADREVQAAMDAAEDVTAEANIVQPGDGREGGM